MGNRLRKIHPNPVDYELIRSWGEVFQTLLIYFSKTVGYPTIFNYLTTGVNEYKVARRAVDFEPSLAGTLPASTTTVK